MINDNLKENVKDYKPYITTIILIFLMSMIVSITCLHEIISGLKFALFLVIVVLVPGTACMIFLRRNTVLSWSATAISFLLGYSFSLFEYFLIMLLGLKAYALYVVIGISLICAIYIIKELAFSKNEKKRQEESKSDNIIILVFVSVIFGASLFASCFCNLIQPVVLESKPVPDMLHWVSNIIELSWEFPPRNFFDYSDRYKYHYFSSAQLALGCLVTGIRPIHIGLYFSVVQSTLMRVLSGYLVLYRSTSKAYLRVIGMILLFFSSGLELKSYITYQEHLYHGPFGTEYALTFFLFFLYLLFDKKEEKTNKMEVSFLIWICLFVLSGIKVAYGGVALFGLGIFCIGLIAKKEYGKAFSTGLPSLVIFLLEYYNILCMPEYLNNPAANYGGNSFIPIWRTPYFYGIYGQLEKLTTILSIPPEPFAIILFILLGSPLSVCGFYGLIRKIRKHETIDILDASLLSMSLIGLLVMIFVQMNGLSNMYFAFAGFPAITVLCIKNITKGNKVEELLFYCVSIFSIIGFLMGYSEKRSLADFIRKGAETITGGKISSFDTDKDSIVTYEEYIAYEWIRLNTPEQCRVATNRVSHAVGAFTERYINNPSHENSIFLSSSENDYEQRLISYKEDGIGYIMYEEAFGDNLDYLDKDCTVVYELDGIKIYETQ